jgi:hypothetical protein
MAAHKSDQPHYRSVWVSVNPEARFGFDCTRVYLVRCNARRVVTRERSVVQLDRLHGHTCVLLDAWGADHQSPNVFCDMIEVRNGR